MTLLGGEQEHPVANALGSPGEGNAPVSGRTQSVILRVVWNETFDFQPEGLGQHSPGQRPGKTIKQSYTS
jgi:hypothetical protein